MRQIWCCSIIPNQLHASKRNKHYSIPGWMFHPCRKNGRPMGFVSLANFRADCASASSLSNPAIILPWFTFWTFESFLHFKTSFWWNGLSLFRYRWSHKTHALQIVFANIATELFEKVLWTAKIAIGPVLGTARITVGPVLWTAKIATGHVLREAKNPTGHVL